MRARIVLVALFLCIVTLALSRVVDVDDDELLEALRLLKQQKKNKAEKKDSKATEMSYTEQARLRSSRTWGRLFLNGTVSPMQYFKGGFGGDVPKKHHRILMADPPNGCSRLANAADIQSEPTFVVVERGDCQFLKKARVIMSTGGMGMILINDDDSLFHPPGLDSQDVKIAVTAVTHNTGNIIKHVLSSPIHQKPLTGVMIPINCDKKKNLCDGVFADERELMTEVEGGVLSLSGPDLEITDIEFLTTTLGGPIPNLPTNKLVIADPPDACSELTAPLSADSAVIVQRGSCQFLDKLLNVQAAGGGLVVFVNSADSLYRVGVGMYESAGVSVSSILVTHGDGKRMVDAVLALGDDEAADDNNISLTVEPRADITANKWDTLRDREEPGNWPPRTHHQDEVYEDLKRAAAGSPTREAFLEKIYSAFTKFRDEL